jgi:hypothetical protein
MSKTLCHITAQRYENYGAKIHGIDHAAWKPKGAQMFSLTVDDDYFFYGEPQTIEAIEQLLREYSNDHVKYEYREHELIFCDIKELDADKFELAYEQIVNKLKSTTNN